MTVAVTLVLLSGFTHATWNLFTKKSLDKNVFLWWCQWFAIVVFLPWVVMDLQRTDIPAIGYAWLSATMVLHGLYVLMLAKVYTLGDLSQVYPIMRGTSPLVVPILGVLLLNESLTALGWLGVLCILAGILSISEIKRGRSASLKAPLFAVAVGLCTSSYIVLDKVTLAYVTPAVLNIATNVGNLIALTYAAVSSGAIRREWTVNWKTILLGGVLAPGSYLLFLFAMELAPVAQLAPMREIGTVFGTLLGIFLLREQQGKKRVASSILVTAGVVLLGMYGAG